jgi:CRP-like cAMP-binding protein
MRLKKHARRAVGPEEEAGIRKSVESVIAEWKEEYPINKYKAKQVIFNEGNYARELMLVTKGKVKLFKVNADGKEYIVELTNSGDFLGYNSIISSKPLSESACALDDTEICFIPANIFKDLILKNREVGKAFLKILSKDIIEKEEKLLKLAYSSVRQRSADALLLLQKRYGEESSEPFELYISRDDLAAIVGTATESLIRTLSDFKEEGLVEIKGGLIRILNEEGLKSLAV